MSVYRFSEHILVDDSKIEKNPKERQKLINQAARMNYEAGLRAWMEEQRKNK